MQTGDIYRKFASFEARGESPRYEEWAEGVASDADLLTLIDELPVWKRQPNLVFAAARYAGVSAQAFDEFRTELVAAWPQIREIILAKRTQTNEPGRCAVLLPLLAALPQPLALLEVGASAGLCLHPDKFSYQYGDLPRLDPARGPSTTVLSCAIDGPVPVPRTLPEVVWRAGIDLNPLDVTQSEDMRWLEALVWPERDSRRQRLTAAIDIARTDPPQLVRGDLNETIETLASQAPSDATLVVFHSAVLAYMSADAQAQFVATAKSLRGHWISNEGLSLAPVVSTTVLPPPPNPTKAFFVLAKDGEAVAYAGPHGQSLLWFA
jgi:hypothetical protein